MTNGISMWSDAAHHGAKLVNPTVALREEFLAMVEEGRAAGEERYLDVPDVERFDEYVRQLELAAHGTGLPFGIVPSSTYWLVRDATILGFSKLRHYLTPELERHGGHIGYYIRPSERRQGYGSLLLALTLEKARGLGLRRVLVTCDTDNVGSVGVIQRNGGKLENEEISAASGMPIFRFWVDC